MVTTDLAEDAVTDPSGRHVGYLARGPKGGRPVVYLHGAPGSRREQHLVPEEVLERFGVRLVSIDRAGYGATDPLAGGRPARVQDVLTVCDALGIEQFPMVAVSSGGSYALTLAALAPDRVTRVVLSSAQMPYDVDEAVGSMQESMRVELPALRAGRSTHLEDGYEFARSVILDDAASALSGVVATLSAPERSWYAQQWVQEALTVDMQDGVRASIEGFLDDGLSSVRPFEVDVSTVRCPVRAVHGSIDDWEPLANLRRSLAAVPDTQLVVLDGLNHLGPQLYPDLVVSLCVGDW